MADLHVLILSQYDNQYRFKTWTPARIDRLCRTMRCTRYELFALGGFDSTRSGEESRYIGFQKRVDEFWKSFTEGRVSVPRSVLIHFANFERFAQSYLRSTAPEPSAQDACVGFLTAAIKETKNGRSSATRKKVQHEQRPPEANLHGGKDGGA